VDDRERHIWFDSMGLLLAVLVAAADDIDATTASDLLHQWVWEGMPRLDWFTPTVNIAPAVFKRLSSHWGPFGSTMSADPKMPIVSRKSALKRCLSTFRTGSDLTCYLRLTL
jgi:hypothetical protein